MTSDELFWRLVTASNSLDEAGLLWWLAAVRADEFTYRIANRAIGRYFGGVIGRPTLDRVSARLRERSLITASTLRNHHVNYKLNFDKFLEFAVSGQFEPLRIDSSVVQFDPICPQHIGTLDSSTAWARACMICGNREEPLVLAWLHAAGAHVTPLRTSSRQMESALDGQVDRRTAMRALARLSSASLVSITSLGRAGTEYQLDGAALEALLRTFPFPEDAAATMPGWANLSFPLLQRLDLALAGSGAAVNRAADVAAMEA